MVESGVICSDDILWPVVKGLLSGFREDAITAGNDQILDFEPFMTLCHRVAVKRGKMVLMNE